MRKIAKKHFVLIDGSSYLYRAFHALPPLTNSKGEPTGAILGVINMIRKLLADYEPEYMAVVFDAKGKSFRHDIYPLYKANRPVMPPELRSQVEPLRELIKAMGLPLIVIEGVEADDVIGTLAVRAKKAGMDTLISTGDKDMAQLVSENISLINTMSNVFFDSKKVEEKYGVPPERIIDYLALVGDTSDNIPGVPKVGSKTAVKWIKDYGSLEEIIKHDEEIGGKIGENLQNCLEQLPISKKLIALKLNIELGFGPKDLKRQQPDNKKLIELLKNLEFKRWLSEILKTEAPVSEINIDCQTILTEKDLDNWLKKLSAADSFAVDTETTSLDPLHAELTGIAFAIEADQACYIPVAHDYQGAPKQLNRDLVLRKLEPLLEDENKIKLAQNAKYDMEVLANYDINLQGVRYDTMLESYVLNSSGNRHNLSTLALQYLGINKINFEDIAGSGKKQLKFNQISIEQAAPYSAEDADVVLRLHKKMWPKLAKESRLLTVFDEIEMPLVEVLAKLELNGVCIDVNLLKRQSADLAKRINSLEEQAHILGGCVFNLSSPRQLQEVLYYKLKLPISKKTPTGQPSTAEGVLQKLALDYPLPKIILEHRSLSKIKSTYTDALPLQINSQTGRVHTSYNQAVTATGRLSSTNPNLQNIPIRTEEGKRIRQAFVAPRGKKIVSADYSQIELRIMAHISKDKGLIKAFSDGEDIHRATAAEVFGILPENVSEIERRRAKAINFGLIYGMSAFGLAQQLNISREQAQNYIDLYFERYPKVQVFMQEMRKQARKTGYVETMFGRRLYVPDINSSNFQRQSAAERAAINAPMQGTAADIIKIAMININKWLEKTKTDVKMIIQVHDELVFEVAANDVEKAVANISQYMQSAVTLSVPIEVHVGIGNNWDEAH